MLNFNIVLKKPNQLSRSVLDSNEISKMKRTLSEILTFIETYKEQVRAKNYILLILGFMLEW